jgi:Na+(H+)/acetate symporter ActP
MHRFDSTEKDKHTINDNIKLKVYLYINECCILQGGIKAVIWTDVFQSIILFMGIFAILIQVSKSKTSK